MMTKTLLACVLEHIYPSDHKPIVIK